MRHLLCLLLGHVMTGRDTWRLYDFGVRDDVRPYARLILPDGIIDTQSWFYCQRCKRLVPFKRG